MDLSLELKSRRQRTASWLQDCVLQLGPTFIKLGQQSSARSDLFPREFVDELPSCRIESPRFHERKLEILIQLLYSHYTLLSPYSETEWGTTGQESQRMFKCHMLLMPQ